MSQLFSSGGQRIGVSPSASVLPLNFQGRFPLGWTSWISLQSKGLSRVSSNTAIQTHQSSVLWHSAFFMVQLSHPYTTTGKTIALTVGTFLGKVMSLLFNTLSLSWLSPQGASVFYFVAAVTVQSDFGAQENTSQQLVTVVFNHWVALPSYFPKIKSA